jgi:hypothetical protein
VKICEDDKTPADIGIPAPHTTHLTNVLRRCGVLGDGLVCDVVVESSRNTILSRIFRLRLGYDGAAVGAPTTVMLKTGLPGRAGDGHQEVAFYNQVASVMSVRIAPRCFEAHKNGERDDVRLFDWDSWRIDAGSDDLAYMIAMHWYPDRRRR